MLDRICDIWEWIYYNRAWFFIVAISIIGLFVRKNHQNIKNITNNVNTQTTHVHQGLGYLDVSAMIKEKLQEKEIEVDTEVNKRFSEIPENERVKNPPLDVIAPAIELAQYRFGDVHTKNMLGNLISGALNCNTSHLTHPAFVDIIKQLNSFDIKLLSDISLQTLRDASKRQTTICGVVYELAELRKILRKRPDRSFPRAASRKDFSVEHLSTDYNLFPEETELALDNLMRLNLIKSFVCIPPDDWQRSEYMTNFAQNAQNIITTEQNSNISLYVEYICSCIQLTSLGISFCDIVLPDSKKQSSK